MVRGLDFLPAWAMAKFLTRFRIRKCASSESSVKNGPHFTDSKANGGHDMSESRVKKDGPFTDSKENGDPDDWFPRKMF